MIRILRRTLLLLPVFVVSVSFSEASAIGPSRYLRGTVSFDNTMKLYRYDYVVHNASGLSSIGEVAILVDSSGYYVAPNPNHIPHTNPEGFRIYEAVTGSIEDPPHNIVGTMFVWATFDVVDRVPRGGTLGGFSFSVPFPPATGQNNNYFLYSFDDRRVVDYGRVVAPDFRGMFQMVPEPGTLMLAGMVLLFGTLGFDRRGK